MNIVKIKSRHADITKLRHLNATFNNFVPRGRGNCIQQAVAMVMDVPTAKLIIGTLFSDHSYIHAWVEDRGVFYDPSRFEEDGCLKPYEKEHFIECCGVKEAHVVARKSVLDFARRGSLSRWITRSDDTYHTLGKVMGHALLDELGIPYFVDEYGFLFPASDANLTLC